MILSAGWHLFWGLFFDLSLEEKAENPGKQMIPVYYIGKSPISKNRTIRGGGTVTSVFPQFTLPKPELIQPPLPSQKSPEIEEEMLARKSQEIAEYKMEPISNKTLEPDEGRKSFSNWILPPKTSKAKQYPIIWEGKEREIIYSYFPPYPQWAQEKGITSSVILKFKVSNNGNVKEVRIDKSSGETKLDLLAIDYLRRWQFLPLDSESAGLITMEFGR